MPWKFGFPLNVTSSSDVLCYWKNLYWKNNYRNVFVAFIGFSCNTKSSVIVFVFLHFLLLISAFKQTGYRLLLMFFLDVTQDQAFLICFTKKISVTNISLVIICDACGPWYAISFSLPTVTTREVTEDSRLKICRNQVHK